MKPIPNEIKDAVKSLNHPLRWKIIEYLASTGDIKYGDLLSGLNLSNSILDYHLTKLMLGAMVDNYSKGQFQGPHDSYYCLSRFGTDIINGLFSSLELKTKGKQ